jgi:hypothetical protein
MMPTYLRYLGSILLCWSSVKARRGIKAVGLCIISVYDACMYDTAWS